MKKIISMALVVIMLVCSAVTLTACGIPSDYKDAKANLEEKDYTVKVTTTDALIKAELLVLGITDVDVDALVEASKDEDGIDLIYCNDKDSADKILEKIEKFIDESKQALDELFEDKDSDEYKKAMDEFNKMKVGKSGTVVYMATEQALKDVK